MYTYIRDFFHLFVSNFVVRQTFKLISARLLNLVNYTNQARIEIKGFATVPYHTNGGKKDMRLRSLCLLVLCVVVYTIATVMFLHSRVKKQNMKKSYLPPKLIVLVSQPRSGSTFLGNLISKAIQSVYFYEPLYKLDSTFKIDINLVGKKQRQQNEYDDMAGEYLRKVFACDFSDQASWHRIFESPFKVLSSNECNDNHHNSPSQQGGEGGGGYRLNRCLPYFNSNQIQKNCQRMNLMVKLLELRVPYGELAQLQPLTDRRAKYQVLYLVRDPRAAFLSLLKTGWVAENATSPTFKRYVQTRCDEMVSNIIEAKKMQHTVMVRYVRDHLEKTLADVQKNFKRISKEF